jgi:U3 small nucleolar RNA-associated protein 6
MAEVVQRHLEDMLSEFEQAKRIGLFTEAEIKKMIRTRRRHEYKIIRRTKEKECYLDYIKYETHLLKLVHLRREKLKLGRTYKKNEIDLSIKRRIERLFRSVCHRFKNDVQLWLTFIEFLQKQHDYSTASSTFTSALQTHGTKYWLWIMAAKFEFEVMVSPSSARSLFQRALRLMPQEKKLWLEYFKFELLYVELVQKRQAVLERTKEEIQNNEEDAVLQGKIVQIVFNNAQETIENDPKFVCSFVKILYEFSQFSFVESFIDHVYSVLKEKYSSNALAQSLLAQRPLVNERKMLDEATKKEQDISFMIAVLEQQVRENYEEELKNSRVDKNELWNLYLDFCVRRLSQASDSTKNEHIATCDQVFSLANEQISLTPERYLEWVSIVDNKRARLVIQKATDRYPNDPTLWNKRLSLLVETSTDSKTIKNEFKLACQNSDIKKSALIWNTIIEYAQEHDSKWTEELFEQSQSESLDLSVALELKSKYLQWINQTKSIKQVRKLFDKLSSRIPASLSLYLDYIKIEQSSSDIDNTRIKTAFEQAIIYFGQTSADLWLAYLDHLKQHQSLDFVTISRLHSRAVHALDSDELKRFNTECALKNLT